jgi:hypothetical protein
MFKVFESFDYMEAGRVRSLLEANGIRTFMKNEFLSGALGDLPFQEVAPMVFVVEESDLPAALALLRADQEGQGDPDDAAEPEDPGRLEA